MNNRVRFFLALVSFAAVAVRLPALEADKRGSLDDGQKQSLEKLGFFVFPKPMDLPSFALPAIRGADLTPASLKGTVTLFNFWATWCPPCRREMPSIGRLETAMNGYAFRIAAISTGEKRRTVEDFLGKNGYAFPVYLDEKGRLGASFASQGIPTTYILDKAGRIVAGIVGSREYDDPALIAVLKEMATR